MSSVGLGMIFRNDADVLPVCLESVKDLFDETVAVDTGSTDGSREIFEQFGARIVDFPWIYDFSAARNAAWDGLKTDWKFWIDCDDILLGRERFDEMVQKCEAMNLDGVILEYLYAFDRAGVSLLANIEPSILNRTAQASVVVDQLRRRCVTTQYRERLVRHDPTWRWVYPIHEALPATGRRLGKFEGVQIIHRRHVRRHAVSSGRNLDILNRVPVEKRDERIWFYFGLEHASQGHLDEARQAFEQYVPKSTVPDELYLASHFLADLYRAKEDFRSAEMWDLRALALRPTWRDAYAGLLETYAKQHRWQEALYYGAMAEKSEIPDTPFAYNPLHEEIGWIGDYMQALIQFQQFPEALRLARRYLDRVPDDAAMLFNLDSLSAEMNIQSGMDNVAAAVEFFLRQDDTESAALMLSRLNGRMLKHPDIAKWIDVVGSVCGPAARGVIPADHIKVHPAERAKPDFDLRQLPWNDPRAQHLKIELFTRPYTRRILQIGGPAEAAQIYSELGIHADRSEHVDRVVDSTYDMVVLWSCLERVKYPDVVVQKARRALVPGGDLVAFVPNGPASRGLIPPEFASPRLRAFSADVFRQVMGTVRMPVVSAGWSGDSGDLALVVPQTLLPGRMKTIAIVCPLAPEMWGPFSLDQGIGGSEEAVVRLSRAFTKRGHRVVVYGSGWSGIDDVDGHSGILYAPMSDYDRADVLIGWRYPEIFCNQVRPFDAGYKILWLHDSIDRARVEQALPFIDKVWCISDYHAGLYKGLDKVYSGRNGIDPHEFDFSEINRNPAKLVYVSSPFRGLGALLFEYWPRIKQKVPEAELHAYYGFESADRMGVTSSPEGAAFKSAVLQADGQNGFTWHGRVGQDVLYREVRSAGAWCYSANWAEENCISAYLSQACGTWPVVFPLGALPQSVVFGWKSNPEQFVDHVVEAIYTEDGRDRMAEWARQWLSWDDVASVFERLWLGLAA